jgi:hypothetical protein
MVLKIVVGGWDTCECIVEYIYDTEDPQFVRTVSKYINICAAHSSIADNNDRMQKVIEENRRKNFALSDCINNGPSGLFKIDSGVRVLADNVSVSWLWSGNLPTRTLSLSFSGITLTNTQKNVIRNILNSKYGGSVILL